MRKRLPRRRPVPPLPAEPQVTNPQLRAAILEMVDTQLREGRPPQARQTLERLVAAGHSPEGARQLIAAAIVNEIFSVMAAGQPYDEARYLAALAALPQLPGGEPE